MPCKLAPAKRDRMIEPNKAQWIENTRHELLKTGVFKTAGSDSLDKMLRLPMAPLDAIYMSTQVPVEDINECQLCDRPITTEYIDGVVKGARCWANMCVTCHTKEGVGLGTGRGQRFKLVSDLVTKMEVFQKVEG